MKPSPMEVMYIPWAVLLNPGSATSVMRRNPLPKTSPTPSPSRILIG